MYVMVGSRAGSWNSGGSSGVFSIGLDFGCDAKAWYFGASYCDMTSLLYFDGIIYPVVGGGRSGGPGQGTLCVSFGDRAWAIPWWIGACLSYV